MGLTFSEHRFLKEFSTLAIGGPIRYFARIHNVEEMREGLLFAKGKGLPFFILGKGSNCLFDDRGYSGVVLLNKIDHCTLVGTHVSVGSGYSFPLLGVQTSKKGLSGLEFSCAIPATVGGAIFMNAGANGLETSTHLLSVDYMNAEGDIRTYAKNELTFQYRYSSFHEMKGAITGAKFSLIEGGLPVRKKQLELISYRKKTQPLTEKSAGCIFRNPSQTVSAGALIDRCGLKGKQVGNVKVSEKHANFILNNEGASAKEVLDLIAQIQDTVKRETGIELEPEIRQISDE